MTPVFFDFPITLAVWSVIAGVFSMGLFGIVAVVLTVEVWLEVLIAAVALDLCWDAVQLLVVLVAALLGGA